MVIIPNRPTLINAVFSEQPSARDLVVYIIACDLNPALKGPYISLVPDGVNKYSFFTKIHYEYYDSDGKVKKDKAIVEHDLELIDIYLDNNAVTSFLSHAQARDFKNIIWEELREGICKLTANR